MVKRGEDVDDHTAGGTDTRQKVVRFLAVGLLLLSGLSYLRDRLPRRTPLPLAPLIVSPNLETADRLPAAPGDLEGYDVVLVTLDTTRPDRLGCYGNSEGSTPNFDRLARDGAIFTRAVATGSTTLPTHASILTGLYSQRHGARANSLYRLPDDQGTIAEALSVAGYSTGAFVSSFVLHERFGLAQGFDVYNSVGSSAATDKGGFTERNARDTSELAIRWLRRQGTRPYFLWVHYYDPHAPHQPPSPFKEAHAVSYDGELAFVDHEFGRVLSAARSAGRRKTLVVVVGDHAEAFGEHGEWTHGYLVQEATLRVPLIIQATGGLKPGLHVDTRVSQVDLMPTILSLLGVDGPGSLDGVSLSQKPDPARTLLAEAVEGRAKFGWARLAAAYQGSLKYIDGPNPALYDLASDPLERDDVAAIRTEDASKMRRLLREREGPDANQIPSAGVSLEAADIQRLAALGYVGGAAVASSDGTVGADPAEMIAVMVEMQELLDDFQTHPGLTALTRMTLPLAGKTAIDSRAKLIEQLEQLASDHPDFAPVYPYLATSYDKENRPEDAARARKKFESMTAPES